MQSPIYGSLSPRAGNLSPRGFNGQLANFDGQQGNISPRAGLSPRAAFSPLSPLSPGAVPIQVRPLSPRSPRSPRALNIPLAERYDAFLHFLNAARLMGVGEETALAAWFQTSPQEKERYERLAREARELYRRRAEEFLARGQIAQAGLMTSPLRSSESGGYGAGIRAIKSIQPTQLPQPIQYLPRQTVGSQASPRVFVPTQAPIRTPVAGRANAGGMRFGTMTAADTNANINNILNQRFAPQLQGKTGEAAYTDFMRRIAYAGDQSPAVGQQLAGVWQGMTPHQRAPYEQLARQQATIPADHQFTTPR
jgi:hypothetical protein